MDSAFTNNNQIGVVSSFSELVKTSFNGSMNAICWFRELAGDFEEIVSKLQLEENVTEVFKEDLLSLQLSEIGTLARDIILNDLQLLTEFGAQPSLNLIRCYDRDDELDYLSTDVYSYHVDRSHIGTDTYLCTYYGAASDIIPNNQVTQKIIVPQIREQLRNLHDGTEAEFESFLTDNFYDLHYLPNSDAKPKNLGTGHLWRLAVDHPSQQVLPCVHRAPVENEGQYRLLLIC